MQKENLKYYSYPLRHRLISLVRDLDIKGFRKLSIYLPKWFLPNPKNITESIVKTIHGIKMIINPSIDNGVELSLFETGTYEKGILSFIETKINSSTIFVDVGANIGLFSVFVASKFPTSKVISFEPHPETFKLLERNIRLNDLFNVKVIQKALGNSMKSTYIFDNININRGASSLVVKGKSSKIFAVEIVSLDSIINDLSPDIIKIDVEGLEFDVLKGAEKTIKKNLPILIVEISNLLGGPHNYSNKIVDYIKSMGNYKIYKLKGGKERNSRLVEVLNYEDLPEDDNIICIT